MLPGLIFIAKLNRLAIQKFVGEGLPEVKNQATVYRCAGAHLRLRAMQQYLAPGRSSTRALSY